MSTTDQNPAAARDDLRRAAEARGLAVVIEVEEHGSGSRNDRPGWNRVLAEARQGRIGTVLVWKLDRAGRSALDLLANLRDLEKAGVRFVAVTQSIDISPGGDPMSRLLVTMLAAIAEFERDLIRERTRLGLATARKKGKKLGRRPTKYVPRWEEVANLRSRGLSWRGVAGALGCALSTACHVFKEGPPKGLAQLAETGGAV